VEYGCLRVHGDLAKDRLIEKQGKGELESTDPGQKVLKSTHYGIRWHVLFTYTVKTTMKQVDKDAREIVKGEKDSEAVHSELSESEKLMPELRTLAYCQNNAVKKGYTGNFKATLTGLEFIETGKSYKPEQIKVVDFHRFEGITDPADMAVLYVIETDDGAKGTLVDAYGTYSDPDVAKVMIAVDQIAKKTPTLNTGK
jgi:hypothetical protein